MLAISLEGKEQLKTKQVLAVDKQIEKKKKEISN